METNNFNLYIGSKACVAEMHGEKMDKVLMRHSCERMGVSDSMYKEGPVVLIQHGTEGETEFFLSEAKLILRPMSDLSDEKINKPYQALYEPHPNISVEDYWWDKEIATLRNPAKRLSWLIKEGFDVGLIPEGKFILTTDLPE